MTDSMTPEDTPRMAERTDRQAQIDPWKRVETYVSDICLPDGDMFDVDVCLRTEVDAARAADALRHQQELRAALSTAEATIAADAALLRERDAQIASLTAERDQMAAIIRDTLWMAARYADGRRSYAVGLYNDARVKAEALGCAHEAWPAVDGMDPERPTLTEELATLRAERDALVKDIEDWKREQAEGDRAYSALEAERDAAQQEIEQWKRFGDAEFERRKEVVQENTRLAKLAYLGDHRFPDLTYKAQLDELVPQHRALEQENKTIREALEQVLPQARHDGRCMSGTCRCGISSASTALSSFPRPQEPQPAEQPKPPKPVINLMEALKKSLDSLNAKPTSQEP